MKKRICIIFICLAAGLILPSCAKNENASKINRDQSPSVSDVLEAEIERETNEENLSVFVPDAAKEEEDLQDQSVSDEENPALEEKTDTETSPAKEEKVDVDLTDLPATMVYSEVYNMMVSPDQYIGKTIKMDGMFTALYDETTGNTYFACIIQDATACCAQGIEFVLTDEYKYPEDYPEEGGNVCVVGVFDTYMEGENKYCTLRNAKLL